MQVAFAPSDGGVRPARPNASHGRKVLQHALHGLLPGLLHVQDQQRSEKRRAVDSFVAVEV